MRPFGQLPGAVYIIQVARGVTHPLVHRVPRVLEAGTRLLSLMVARLQPHKTMKVVLPTGGFQVRGQVPQTIADIRVQLHRIVYPRKSSLQPTPGCQVTIGNPCVEGTPIRLVIQQFLGQEVCKGPVHDVPGLLLLVLVEETLPAPQFSFRRFGGRSRAARRVKFPPANRS